MECMGSMRQAVKKFCRQLIKHPNPCMYTNLTEKSTREEVMQVQVMLAMKKGKSIRCGQI